ncbi:MAG: hypothetical protein RRC34_15300 [Lentisphaeria bacterium]|nr:hypothetical protein [Lentisphaeria bacterium]
MKDAYIFPSRRDLVWEFIRLHRAQWQDRRDAMGAYAAKNGVSLADLAAHPQTEAGFRFFNAYSRSKPLPWKAYQDFIDGIPFGDLVMIEKLIGNADFQVRAGLNLTAPGQTEARYNRNQRWTVFQHIPVESDEPPDMAEKRLLKLERRYAPAALEHILFNLTPSEYRETGEIPPPPLPEDDAKEMNTPPDKPRYNAVEGHGDHWDAALGDVEKAMEQLPRVTTEEAEVVGYRDYDSDPFGKELPHKAFAMAFPKGKELQLMVLGAQETVDAKELSVWSFYPSLPLGTPVPLEILDVLEWQNGIEAQIVAATEWGAMIGFFDPTYFLRRGLYRIGRTYDIRLAGLAYCLGRTTLGTKRITEGKLLEWHRELMLEENPDLTPGDITYVDVDMRGLVSMIAKDKVVDDIEFHGPATVIERVSLDGIPFLRYDVLMLRGSLAESDAPPEYSIPVFARADLLNGDPPNVGDPVEGVMWLQGSPCGVE